MMSSYDSDRVYVCDTCLSSFDEPDSRNHDGDDVCPVCWSSDIGYKNTDDSDVDHTRQR